MVSSGGGQVGGLDQLGEFLHSHEGFSAAGEAGWLGNTQVESGGSTTASNPAEGAIGWQQWEGGRRTLLDQLAASLGVSETDPRAQEAMIATELQGYPQLLQELRTTTDPGQAAADVDTIYERSSGSTHQERINDARTIYQQLAAGQALGGGGAGGVDNFAGVANLAGMPNPFPGGAWDPLNWPNEVTNTAAGAVGSVAGGVLKVVLPFVTKAAFVVGGLGLVVVGLNRAAAPAQKNLAQQLGPLLAVLPK